MKSPNCFIVGGPRCGTTALFDYLSQHPDFFPASLKEPHFFGTDNYYPNRPTLAEYLGYFAGARGEKCIGEASTSYLFSTLAAKEIREFLPSARIVAIVRNPVEMMYSLHSMVLYYCDEDIEDFETALALEDDRKKGLHWPSNPHIINYLYYRDAVRYTEQVKRYFQIFGRDQVRVLIHDDFKTSLPQIYRDTLAFLDIDSSLPAKLQPVNLNRSARSQRLQAMILSQSLARIRRRVLPVKADELLFGTLRRLNTSSHPRPPMRTEIRRQLQAEFRPEVESLSALLDRDLTHWCRTCSPGERIWT